MQRPFYYPIWLSFCAFFVFCCFSLEGTASKGLFKKYPNTVFIETGSFQGDSIQDALEAGFSKIYSIELFPQWYYHCAKRFKDNAQVNLFLGDSAEVLEVVLTQVYEPATIWLDGHYSGPGTALGKTHTPLLSELKALQKHPIKTHTILIDDIRQLGSPELDFIEKEELIAEILKVNPLYEISYDEGVIPGDVLVAQIKETQE